MSLTDSRVKSAKPRLADYTLADGNGLYLRVRRSGAKTWITRRMTAGKVHVQTIGTYGDGGMPLADARLIAAGKAVDGGPPDKRKVASLCEQYAKRVVEKRYKDSRPIVRYFERDIVPAIGKKLVADVEPADIDRLLQEKLEDGPVAANMLLLLLKGMFAFAVRTGWTKANPAASFTRNEAGGRQKPRQRELSDAELRALWNTPTKHVGTIRLAILTGCRISEACLAEWSQFDFKARRWTLPASATKQGREHWYALSPQAVALLEAQPRTADRVFPGANRIVIANTLVETRKRGADVDPDYHVHDARRTMATRLGKRKPKAVNPLVIELMLGHALPKVLATYNVAPYDVERREASDWWGRTVAKIVKGAR